MRLAGVWRGGAALGLVSALALAAAAAQSASLALPDRIGPSGEPVVARYHPDAGASTVDFGTNAGTISSSGIGITSYDRVRKVDVAALLPAAPPRGSSPRIPTRPSRSTWPTTCSPAA